MLGALSAARGADELRALRDERVGLQCRRNLQMKQRDVFWGFLLDFLYLVDPMCPTFAVPKEIHEFFFRKWTFSYGFNVYEFDLTWLVSPSATEFSPLSLSWEVQLSRSLLQEAFSLPDSSFVYSSSLPFSDFCVLFWPPRRERSAILARKTCDECPQRIWNYNYTYFQIDY